MNDKELIWEAYNTVNEGSFSSTVNSSVPSCRKDFDIRYGMGGVTQKGNKLYIHYGGNMGAGMREVEELVSQVFDGETLESLKSSYEVVKETGSPDYSWGIVLRLPRGACTMNKLSDWGKRAAAASEKRATEWKFKNQNPDR